MTVQLRYYQDHQSKAVSEQWREGKRAVCLVSPTGSGKRLLAIYLMNYASEHGRKALFVCNRRLLIHQAQADAELHEVPHGVIMADSPQDMQASNQLASIQTLESWYFYDPHTGRPSGTGLPPANLIIIDEAHRDGPRVKQLLDFYPDAKVLGLTATPVGPDGRSLVPSLFDVLVEVESARNSSLIRNGFLRRTRVFAPSEPDIRGVSVNKGQEYNQKSLGKAVEECTVFCDVFAEWEKHAGRATVIFVPGIPFGNHLAMQINARYGEGKAAVISAKTKLDERRRLFDAMADGSMKALISYDVLREGFDMPSISCAIDLQPVKQLRTYWQKVGRIKRPHEAADHAVLLDFAGNYWKFPHPDEDPEWPTGGETTQEAIERRRAEGAERQPIMCPACGFVRDQGPRCPACGHEAGPPIRRIRTGKGKLREIPAFEKKKREKTAEELAFLEWKKVLFGAMKYYRTLNQCSMLYKKRTGQWPKPWWPCSFHTRDLNSHRYLHHMHSLGSLAAEVRRFEQKRFK